MQTVDPTQPIKLNPAIQRYDWGKQKAESLVAALINATEEGPYAELWFGAHPKAPAQTENGSDLSELISKHRAAILGSSESLPFLFKILSVGSALSIQAHPDKTLAKRLFQRDPKNYPDSNHKPELSVALTPVSLLYGFRPLSEISFTLKRHPEITDLLLPETVKRLGAPAKSDPKLLREIYSQLVTPQKERLEHTVRKLFDRLSTTKSRSEHEKWFLELAPKHNFKDIGLLTLYLLNIVSLKIGEGIFIGANVAHAYLCGDMVECMANSDNVVRAGLTQKFQDIQTLVEMLSYTEPVQGKLKAEKIDHSPFQRYRTPATEFELQIAQKIEPQNLTKGDSAELLFCLSGAGEIISKSAHYKLTRGVAYLLSAALKEFNLTFSGGDLFRVTLPVASQMK